MQIVLVPDPRLRLVSKPVKTFTARIRRLIDELASTFIKLPDAVGLAAIQLGEPDQIFVADARIVAGAAKRLPVIFANPTVSGASGVNFDEEACLSVPNRMVTIPRATKVRIQALNAIGHPFDIACSGFAARVVLHELDHLEGKLITDYEA